MKHLLFLALVILAPVLLACYPVPAAAPTVQVPPVAARPSVLRIEIPEELDVPDIPRALAIETLREMGYTVEALEFVDNAQSAQALEQGDLDIGNISSGIAWSAIQQGAKSMTILDDTTDSRVLLTRDTIQKCSDLDGKRVAVSSLTATQTLMVEHYIAKNCPGAKIEPLVIAGSSARVAGLIAGQLDAVAVTLGDFINFQRQGNPGVHAFVFFTTEFPGLRGTSQIARRELLEKYPETVKDYIRASLLARRKINDPELLAELIVKYVKLAPEEAKEVAQTFLEHKMWDLNGGLSPENLQTNIDFFVESGGLKPGLKPDDVADLSYLNAVLAEIGKK